MTTEWLGAEAETSEWYYREGRGTGRGEFERLEALLRRAYQAGAQSVRPPIFATTRTHELAEARAEVERLRARIERLRTAAQHVNDLVHDGDCPLCTLASDEGACPVHEDFCGMSALQPDDLYGEQQQAERRKVEL